MKVEMKVESMSMAELNSAIERMKSEMEKRRADEIASVVADISEKMDRYGLTVADLGFTAGELSAGRSRGKSRSTGQDRRSLVEPKFRDPETGTTWYGRGRMPRWMTEAVDAGRSREEFRIGG